ncbi:transcription factor Opi1-domain-containing protein [Cantharellus anzutake]|uniref:transcription factor Opi1-domain-containing protein n=1 Tax=Cantharellus anzutake TaxID=1750568 RepID=UPI0019072770|nr:transcription factor Opi1-domain-containing protein [Cantharellus anzutake]KAF8327156.1 transcription factor Opi1-domain-containing protein [Cantharellus anzutake]
MRDGAHQRTMEDDEAIAVSALGEMRNGAVSTPVKRESLDTLPTDVAPALPIDPRYRDFSQPTSSQATPSLSLASSDSRSTISDTASNLAEDDTLLIRMSNLPLVHPALRAYDYAKNSSRVVKFGAEVMEGTVKTMTRPVIDRLPVNQFDEFACRQLDRFGRYGGKPEESSPMHVEAPIDSGSPNRAEGSSGQRGRKHLWLDNETRQSPTRESSVGNRDMSGDVANASSSRYSGDSYWNTIAQQQQQSSSQEVQIVSRSRWQAVLLEAGGIGAAVSEESMKRLKYCLQWLQYANAHIDQQILVIRSFITSIAPQNLASSSTSNAVVPFQTLGILSQIKTELINTIRQVVDVVSKYAGSALPEQARNTVRSFILRLPERWANALRLDETNGQYGGFERNGQGLSGSAATMAATRVLTLATESLDMMRGVTGVFKDSLDRAEAWVDRLQQLGLQRQQQQALPPTSSLVQFSATYPTPASNSTCVPSHRQSYEPDRQRDVAVSGVTTSASYSASRQTTRSPSPSTQAASEYGSEGGNETETGDDMRKSMDVDQ